MKFTSHARTLAIAFSLALVAGCTSTGGSQDGTLESGRDGADGRGAAGTGQVSGTGVRGSGSDGRDGQQQDGRIPQERTIYFEFDSDTIQSQYESVLVQHARYLNDNPNARVVLEGHTDARGTREYNMALGERRAKAVRRFLEIQDVSPSRVEIVSYGEERPAARGEGDDAYAKNRRVVFAY